jgi:RHS repeat-associated protein
VLGSHFSDRAANPFPVPIVADDRGIGEPPQNFFHIRPHRLVLVDGKLTAGEQPTGDFKERFEYDDRGRQTLHVSFEGVVTQNVYDDRAGSNGRLAAKRFFLNESQYSGAAGAPSETWTYQYDAFGREVEARQDNCSTIRVAKGAYDAEGRLIQVDTPEGVITYAYDDLGRKTGMNVYPANADPSMDPPERVTTYAYDALSRLKSVSEDLDPASALDDPLDTLYGYDLLGNLRRTDLPNGVVTENVFDELNRLDVMTHYVPDATPEDLSNNDKLAEFDYTLRADGKRTCVTETYWLDADQNPATPATPHVNQIDWTYDEIGRLTDEVFNHFDNTLDQTEHFTYDLVGNRLALTKDKGNNASIDDAITYSYDANDRLIDELLDSDNNGQTDQTTTYGWTHTQQASKTVVDTTTAQTKSKVFFDCDLQGRMAQVETETWTNGAVTHRERVSYDYDATGIRVASLHEVSPDGDTTFETSTRTEYLVDHHNFTGYQQVLKETTYDGQGNIAKTIEYTIGHDEIAQTVTEFDAPGNPTSETTHIFGHDGHGSVRVLFDMAAAIAQLYAFEAYGQLLAIHDGAAQFVGSSPALAFTTVLQNGEQFDTRINHLWLRARWFDPRTGRYTRLDVFFGNLYDPQSFHKYLFVHGDPINGIDPTGLALIGLASGSLIGSQLNAFQGETGLKVAEVALASAAGASAGQALAIALFVDILTNGGVPFLGKAVANLLGAFGRGLKELGKVVPIVRGNLVIPGILKLDAGNAANYIDDLFNPALTKNAGNPIALRNNLADMYKYTQVTFENIGAQCHHIIPWQLRNENLLKKLNFNLDAALNAILLNKSVHGWSTNHRAYSKAMRTVLQKIDALDAPDAYKREMLLEVMAKASTAILNGASLKKGAEAISEIEWFKAFWF